jgi:hypothetical protein
MQSTILFWAARDRFSGRPQGRGKGRASLRRMQWEKAEVGDTSMLIWLGKVMCGQKDTSAVVLTGPNNGPVQSQSVSVTVPMNDPIEDRFS